MKRIKDKGPIYKETNPNDFPVDFLSTISNLVFLASFAYWILKLNGNWQNHPIVTITIFLMFAGWVGGTMYHATRRNNFWLMLDLIPIGLVALTVIIYTWIMIGVPWYFAILAIFLPLTVSMLTKVHSTPKGAFIGYGILILPLIIPLYYYLNMTSFAHGIYALVSIILCFISLFFRSIDLKVKAKYGTHWLWHVFGALGVHFMINYYYLAF